MGAYVEEAHTDGEVCSNCTGKKEELVQAFRAYVHVRISKHISLERPPYLLIYAYLYISFWISVPIVYLLMYPNLLIFVVFPSPRYMTLQKAEWLPDYYPFYQQDGCYYSSI